MELQPTPARPAVDVVAPIAPPPGALPKKSAAKPQPETAKTDTAQPAVPINTNVVAAIFATVLIVFGLAALAVYAYLKTNR